MPKLRPLFHAPGDWAARALLLAVAVVAATAATGAPLELKLVGVDGRPVGGAVIALRSIDAGRPVAKPVDAVMNQVKLQFEPHVLVIPTGSRITFPNNDTVRHQVYSFSPPHRFDIDLYHGTPRPEEFDRLGVVTVGCNIHDSMRAFIYVVDAQYFGHMDAAGAWKADVQPGTYNVQVWHPLSRDTRTVLEQQVKVTGSESGLTLRLSAVLRLRPQSQIPANWDAY
jgi:plastocyanin